MQSQFIPNLGSVKTFGGFLVPPQLDVTICEFKFITSSLVSWIKIGPATIIKTTGRINISKGTKV